MTIVVGRVDGWMFVLVFPARQDLHWRHLPRSRLPMSPYDEVYARIEHIKELWRELQRTPRTSPTYAI